MFLSERLEFPSAPCLAGKETWWQHATRFRWNRARPWHASELVFFLVGPRTYQHLGPFNTDDNLREVWKRQRQFSVQWLCWLPVIYRELGPL